jgi:hypothetical protein
MQNKIVKREEEKAIEIYELKMFKKRWKDNYEKKSF